MADDKKCDEDVTPTDFAWFDPNQPVGYTRGGNLPHWRQDGVTYFMTWRTADSMPKERVERWVTERAAWLAEHPEPHDAATKAEYDRLFIARWELWLDECHGECLPGRPDVKRLIANSLQHFQGRRYQLGESVVAPNHVHVLAAPLGGLDLSKVLHSWKSFTAHEINRMLSRRGTFWEKESFDHIPRSASELERIVAYIRGHVDAAARRVL